ncbi:MAG: TadE/TadG family type IV pilus assembly protein [Chloroflexota bacterium]
MQPKNQHKTDRIEASALVRLETTERTEDQERHEHGQSLVEFALILPVFFLLVAGMFDFGLGIYSDLTLVNASREGARLGVIDPGNTAAIESRVRAMANNLDGSKMTVTIKCERPSGSTFGSCSNPMWQPGDATLVTVDYKYSMFFPLLFGTEIPLSSETRMRIE